MVCGFSERPIIELIMKRIGLESVLYNFVIQYPVFEFLLSYGDI